jgi:hypothetical protein
MNMMMAMTTTTIIIIIITFNCATAPNGPRPPHYRGFRIDDDDDDDDNNNNNRVLVRKPEENRALGRPWRRWEDNIKREFQEVEWGRGLD